MSRLAAFLCLFTALPALHAAPAVPKVPPGFQVELLLEAPAIEAPTALCVAPNGDVYFAEDPMDMAGPPTKNLDRIWLLRGGDPKKKVLFADKMWAVMGLEIVRDKLYVVHAPHVTVFTLDADGKAKERTELFDDLGPKVAGLPSFNDHIPSGIRAGQDGWLYVSIGDKGIPSMSRVPIPLRGTEKGKEIEKQGAVHVAEGRWRRTKEGHHISLEGGGVIRFRPDGTGLEVFASGTRNHLDVPLDEHDRIFVRDNTDDGLGWNTRLMYLPPGGFMGYPWAYKRRPRETLPAIHDFGGGSPCGGWVYLDDGLPETYRGRIFHCEWGQGKVWAVKVAPQGAGFRYVDQVAFMDPTGTTVKDFRPFSLRPTADGRGFYVTDWGFSGWLSKTKAGRLWKVTYTGADVKPASRGKDSDTTEQLIEALGHPAHSERLRAQWTLSARGKPAFEAARAALGKVPSDTALIHLLWVLRDSSNPDSVAEWWLQPACEALHHKSPAVRLEAARVIGSYPASPAQSLGKIPPPRDYLLGLLAEESNPQVRLAAVAGLIRQMHFLFDARELLKHLEKETDAHVRHVAIRALKVVAEANSLDPDAAARDQASWSWRNLEGRFNEIAPSIQQRPGKEALLEVLAEEYDPAAVRVLRRLLLDPDAAIRQQVIQALARSYKERKPYAGTWWGTQPAAQKPPARVLTWEGIPAVRAALLDALRDRDESVRKVAVAALIAANDPETFAPLAERFAQEKDAGTRADLVRAIANLDTPKTARFLIDVAHDEKAPESLRLEAVAGLEKFNRPNVIDALGVLLGPAEPAALQVRALEALGNLKASSARQQVTTALRSKESGVRAAAAATLGQLGDVQADRSLLPLLKDPEATVKVAAIRALGALKAKEAIPDLVQAAGSEPTQFDAITALARMPDRRALPAYLTGLTSKNVEMRKACRAAVATLGDEAVPTLEQLARRNEIPSAALAELREVYSSFVPILAWRVIGPFPRDGKHYPPETEQKFDAVYKGAAGEVRWRTVKADASQHGRLNLAALLSPTQQVEAYGFAEIDSMAARDATLLLGSDDTITVWLNGKVVHEQLGDRGWSYNQDKVNVHLEKGRNRLLVKCGNSGGPWEFSVAVSAEADRHAFLRGAAQKFDLEAFRAFARKTPGDAERGQRLFRDVKGLACIKCHAVGGDGGQVGPDLAGIGLKYRREDLMTSILEPSKVIAQGYETILIQTTNGRTLTGVFKGETADAVNLTDADGKAHRIAKKDVDERAFSPVSTMPNGLSDGMTLQDFADLIAYLEARREEKTPPRK
jgi:putative heme-binding domain-containing protein